MSPKKYPLESLVRVRKQREDAALSSHAAHITARALAERTRREAEEERACAEALAQRVREHERCALDRGELRVGDLMHADAWEARVKVEGERLARGVLEAASHESSARDAEARSRQELAHKKADVQVVEKDRARWADEKRRGEEAKDEEAAQEAWRPKRST